MKLGLTSLLLPPVLLALSATALAESQTGSLPDAPAENRRPADWQPSRPAMDTKALIEASAPFRQKAAKAYEELQQTNANGKWKATAASIDQHQAPEWFKDAKFGMFIDWGPWSIAGWAPKQKGQMIPDWYEMDMYRRKDFAAYLYNKAEGRKEVAVNDRYGKDETNKWLRSRRGDFFTSEFGHMGDPSAKDRHAWEECRGISQSYGYNWQDTDENVITIKQLIDMFVDIVTDGGNLLLMVNLDGDGALPKIQETRLRAMGEWLDHGSHADGVAEC